MAVRLPAERVSHNPITLSIRSLKFRVDTRDVDEERLWNLLEEIAVMKRVSRLLKRVDVLIARLMCARTNEAMVFFAPYGQWGGLAVDGGVLKSAF